MAAEPTPERRTWLLMALASADRSYGGNDGYDDDISKFYSWNSRVPNFRAISVGDRVVLWDKVGLLGFSTVERITTGTGTVDRRLCPSCGASDIKYRKTNLDLSSGGRVPSLTA
ncbi:hypothetical protein [Calidifontibacter indicus]|uniref:hypothetical protein n=1 Tax=Calidifontibacter indicus TaxID=419650 RepID=UPI0011C050C1|nr:hypothetical protein [Calidifontibacter indicus]